jgi:hypothetical protein
MLPRKHLLTVIGSLTLLLAVVAPAAAGGWAVATLDQLPTGVVAGEPFTVSFTMRQHGIHPADWGPVPLTFTHADSGRTVSFMALSGSSAGRYALEVTLPQAGTWDWILGDGLPQPMPSLAVAEAVAPVIAAGEPSAPSPLPAALGIMGLAGLGVGLLALFRTHQPWATAVTLIGALVAVLGFTLPPMAPPTPPASSSADAPTILVDHGEALFLAKGCVMCHAHTEVAAVRRQALGDFNSFSTGPDLSQFRASADYLRLWLADPSSVKPDTQMPDLDLSAAEIDGLIAFLNNGK